MISQSSNVNQTLQGRKKEQAISEKWENVQTFFLSVHDWNWIFIHSLYFFDVKTLYEIHF